MTDADKKKLTEFHTEELADVEKYKAFASTLETEGCHTAAGILEDIMHDEKTHAEAIKHILDMEAE